ncbi:RagB/SusD family nutrient uptake outer membrane protein [Dyadobacter sp. CY323]|uniref:RagB/SusD family nutrient uptake outer membrane protein n=1 Tax=Dyadobacter sp. CY323 TaxID=2907302 RepID=UPI001F384A02|nr:RagB/SusD family nutrient uptake outer membrane protein [Dyadobacter sp. CY323]MCE6989688.1 RagB/SusD family nutrient uptake outer membrane protein [Dyadobacter sp. CY323]
MKLYRILILMGAIMLPSCKKGFLDLAPISDTNSVNFYRNADDMLNAVNAAYGSLQFSGMYNLSMYAIGEGMSDNTEILDAQSGIDISQLDAFSTLSNNGIVSTTWNDHYRGILSCNTVIDRIGGVTMDQALKDRFVAEVKFLRALMYFNLVRVFGDVPLVLTETADVSSGYAYTRNPVSEIYTQIIQDLQDAKQKLPASYTGTNVGRATSGAAKGMLAKVYLTQKKWAEAAAETKEIIDSKTYDLLPSYADVFKISNKGNKELLFEVQYKKGGYGLGSPFNNAFAPRLAGVAVTTIGAGSGHNLPTADMNKAYETGDLRKDASLAQGYTSAGKFVPGPFIKKYLDPAPFAGGDADNNWPVLRYADVLLMRAEALNEVGYVAGGEAFTILNSIRKRAGLADKTAQEIPTQAAFRLAIESERRVELAFENHRWFDLVRTGRAMEVMTAKGFNLPAFRLLLPIPLTQIQINPDRIQQNPGY